MIEFEFQLGFEGVKEVVEEAELKHHEKLLSSTRFCVLRTLTRVLDQA